MKKILYIGVAFTLLSSLNACDYNERNFEGLDSMVKPGVSGPFQLEYTEKIFSAESPAKNILPDWIYSQLYAADTGSLVVVKYKYSEPTVKVVMVENFERTVLAGSKTELVGWVNNSVKGEKFWCDKISSGSIITEFSANKATGECEGWLISPKVNVAKGMTLTFDLCVKYYNADCLKVLVSSNFNGYMDATWEDITDRFSIPSKNADMTNAGVVSLDEWVKKDIVIAFQYVGDGINKKTTTMQLDNIAVNSPDVKVSEKEEEYIFKGHADKWVFVREIPKYALKENLDRVITSKQPTVLPGWLNVAKAGTLRWFDKEYSKNVYTEISAYSADGACDVWFITPKLNIFDEMIFSFDLCVGHYNADCLKVLISTDFNGEESGIDGATWTDVTSSFEIPKEPVSGYGKMLPAGKMNIAEYLNKNIYIAFRYQGNKAESKTTTYQLDNFFVGKE